jgi:2-polyprenyl-3-methyl-5-hydroxy-6-metoxy-1,4-benzoquinol methylase
MKCIICESAKLATDYYRPNLFNDTLFHYHRCKACKSVSIDPIPSKADFDKIYGETDHAYIKKMKAGEKIIHDFKWPKYHHQGYQINLFKQSSKLAKGNKLLDFATGSGFYLAYAQTLGFEVVGVEYSQDFSNKMKEKTGLNIISINELESAYSTKKFDIIHFGHILEHLENPYEIIKKLRYFAHDETIIIADGPLEANACLSQKIIRIGAFLKRKKYNYYAPQHLTFTNYNSQLLFFKKAGLKTLKYKVMEQDFPFRIQRKCFFSFNTFTSLLSLCSIQISKLSPKMGNVFHYVGKFEK